MSDFKNIIEFFRLNRRSEEYNENQTVATDVSLMYLEEDGVYNVDKNEFADFNKYKRRFHLLDDSIDEKIYIWETQTDRKYFVKIANNQYRNLLNEILEVVPTNELTAFPIKWGTDAYFYDIQKNRIVSSSININDVIIFADSIYYDPNSELLEDFGQQETLSYSYDTHKTWIYDFLSFLVPNNDAEGDPFAKHVSDGNVEVTQIRIAQKIDIIPIIKESMGKYYANYNVYKKDERKFVPFYLNRNYFFDENIPVVSLTFNSLGAFMAYLNDTIFSQTENFSFGKRPAFLDQYKEIIIIPLIRNLESRSTFSYYDALQALYYLPESLFYLLPEGFLWKFFDKAIANDSFTNKPYSKEEDIFLKILKVLVSSEDNALKFIERLSKNVSEKDPQMLLEFFYERIHGKNFIEFANIVNTAWRKSHFVDANLETNPVFASTNGPTFLPYHSEKLAGFFFSNISASFEDNPKNNKERFLRLKHETGKYKKVTKAHSKAVIYEDDEEIIEYYYYHPFYPVKIKDIDKEDAEQDTAIKLDAIVPAFMLFANSNQQFWNNVIKSGEYALDVAVIALSSGTLSGIAAAEVMTTLAVVRGIGAVSAITSSVANIGLKLSNAQDSELGKSFIEYLFWIELLSLSGELTLAISNGLKRAATKLVAKEEDLAKLEKQLDDLVEQGQIARKDADDLLEHLDEMASLDMRTLKPFPLGSELEVLSSNLLKKYIRELDEIMLKKGYKLEIVWIDEAHEMFNTRLKGRVIVEKNGPIKLLIRKNCPKMAWFHENIHLDDLMKMGRSKYRKMAFEEPWTLEWNVWEGILKNRNKYREIELVSAYGYVKWVYDNKKVLHLFKENKEMELLITKYKK